MFVACSPLQPQISDTTTITRNRRIFTFSSSRQGNTDRPSWRITRYRPRVFEICLQMRRPPAEFRVWTGSSRADSVSHEPSLPRDRLKLGKTHEALVFSASTSDVSQTPGESNGRRQHIRAAAGEGVMHFLPTQGLLEGSVESRL